ncbi:MAG: lipase maturation factor family protein [Candidatus Harrisonbacteria bacterium]|nr:lipase maturation factor family protein [Candidatus Harrisonbacteria bacterium]
MEIKKLDKPFLIYDGDCAFCRIWIDHWKVLTGSKVVYVPFQEVADKFPAIPKEEFQKSVILIMPGGEVFAGAEAVFRALAVNRKKSWILWLYNYLPGFSWISELAYNFISRRRAFFYRITRWFWGKEIKPPTYFLVRWLFLRIFGVIYLIAFVSFGWQILGLIGAGGILPANSFLEIIQQRFGLEGYWLAPTIFWLNAGDWLLVAVSIIGAVFSLVLITGFWEKLALLVLFLSYLSLVPVGQIFMSYQWDILLLEVGFLAILLSYSVSVTWLFRLLLFKFIFLSGAVKLLSGDPSWRNLTALNYHYQTQPLPTILAWYAHQLPEWFQRSSVLVMFFIQLAVPFLIFAPRRLRFFAAGSIVTLEALILLTGNYNFFNLLTTLLCIFLLEDSILLRWTPKAIIRFFKKSFSIKRGSYYGKLAIGVISAVIVVINSSQLLAVVFGTEIKPVVKLQEIIAPFRVVNTYGLFATMTTSRPEIILEGSNDGQNWKEYEFKYKPGNLKRAPQWAAPYQPRLDWQMWFAALGTFRQNLWFVNFAKKILEGSEPVLALLGKNPFPDRPPRYVRAQLYDYQFTNFEEKQKTGDWWKRKLLGNYLPPFNLSGQ